MNTFKSLITIALGVTSGLALADEPPINEHVSVSWESPEDYTDVRAANQSRKRFMEQTFHRFDDYFASLAQRFPDDYQWNIKVTNVDLAGQVWPSSFVGLGQGGQDVRLIKDIDIPRMSFSYKLLSNGELVKEADVDLKDMGFLQRSLHGSDTDPLRYEKRMLKEWFNREFSDYLITAKQ
ncbi:DUF3016 domain-containing protein [Alteromonas facilis]|uniref:DUF3016 domain-containing protein n=1 Tax=Alteromonas facilis TaxID=2048004 RepID=UPI000C289AA6|nr:DUF3016 domain-containing protein [Alteromonas facilis]